MNKIKISLADFFQSLPMAPGNGDHAGTNDLSGFQEILQHLICPEQVPTNNLNLASLLIPKTQVSKPTIDLKQLEAKLEIESESSEEELPDLNEAFMSLAGIQFQHTDDLQSLELESQSALGVQTSLSTVAPTSVVIPQTVGMPHTLSLNQPSENVTGVVTHDVPTDQEIFSTQILSLLEQHIDMDKQPSNPLGLVSSKVSPLLVSPGEVESTFEQAVWSNSPEKESSQALVEKPELTDSELVAASLTDNTHELELPISPVFEQSASIPNYFQTPEPVVRFQATAQVENQILPNIIAKSQSEASELIQVSSAQGGLDFKQFITDEDIADQDHDIDHIESGVASIEDEQSPLLATQQSKGQQNFFSDGQEPEYETETIQAIKPKVESFNISQTVHEPFGNSVVIDNDLVVPTELRFTPVVEHIYEQIVERIDFDVNQGVQEVRINLKPEHLGEVRIKLTTEQGMINAEFIIANQSVKESIAQSLPQLRSQLQSLGLNLGQVNVDLSNGHEKRQEHFNRQQYNPKYGRAAAKQTQAFSNPVMWDNQSQINLRI